MLIEVLEDAELLAAQAHDVGERRDDAALPLTLAVGGIGIAKPCSSRARASASSFISATLDPRCACPSTALGDRAEAARLFGAVDPHFERHRGSPTCPIKIANDSLRSGISTI